MQVCLIDKNYKQYIDINDDQLKAKGGYVIFFSIKSDKNITVGQLGHILFKTGNYLYIGSAYGMGGFKSRLKRHRQINNKKHWHFDYIRPFIVLDKIKAYIDYNECELVDKYIKKYKANPFYKGLGSSDCTRCKSHFLYYTQL